MDEIARRFPSLSIDHLREVTRIVVEKREKVADVCQEFRLATWGLGCLSCQVVRLEIDRLHRSGEHAWLRYVGEVGMAYTVVIDGIPLRVQPEIDEVRDVMPGEQRAMDAAVAVQIALLPDETPGVLRLEVAQRAGQPVDRVTLFLFEGSTGARLDQFLVYARAVGPGGEADGGSGAPPGGGMVLAMKRPAEDIDPTDRFVFEDDDETAANDDGRDE